MSFYQRQILPHLVHASMRQETFAAYRRRLLAAAEGRVLEIGIGSGLGGGCHLNRPIRKLIEQAGFRFEHVDTGYMKGPKPMTFMYEGSAVRLESSRSHVARPAARRNFNVLIRVRAFGGGGGSRSVRSC